MPDNQLDYEKFIHRAFRQVVADALRQVAAHGLPGDHHLFITLQTDHPGVELPEFLRKRYPERLSIVLQYEFYDLEVGDDSFSVRLSFDNRLVTLVVPFAAIEMFADPAAQFGLRLKNEAAAPEQHPQSTADADTEQVPELGEAGPNVVSLDAFRQQRA